MTALAGIAKGGQVSLVREMLSAMSHRGADWTEISNKNNHTLGLSGTEAQKNLRDTFKADGIACDGNLPGRFARAHFGGIGFTLERDALGVAPLYYGWTTNGDFCFASEVKGLLKATTEIHEFSPGTILESGEFTQFFPIDLQEPLTGSVDEIALQLRKLFSESVENCIADGNVGAWLSGGLDSCVISALASQHVENMHTFVCGLPGAPDLEYAREMAGHLHTRHHEVMVDAATVLKTLPELIYHLESFDALLVRSSIMNYLVARETSRYVPAVFSGEGGDELFAGYAYLKKLEPALIPAELVDITNRLHNTALQRVDRSASSHGVVPLVSFLDPKVVAYALKIPVSYKLHDGVEKWILRKAFGNLFPPRVLNRRKSKFWQGSGIEDLLHNYAEQNISTSDFELERNMSNGWILNTKEELMYYHNFKEHFGMIEDLSWMGRTKGAPAS